MSDFLPVRILPKSPPGAIKGLWPLGCMVALTALLVGACGLPPGPSPYRPAGPPAAVMAMPPGPSYAGEVLAYQMQVVLGRAGHPDNRSGWRQRGLDLPLELDAVNAVLNGDQGGKAQLLIIDPRMIGLSSVLYHYDQRLNQFKGRLAFDSLYPSAEMLALRLLLLHKQARGEKIRLSEVLARWPLLAHGQAPVSATDLEAMNLSRQELALIRDVLAAEPSFDSYLHHPHVVAALVRCGLVQEDAAVMRIVDRAIYRNVGIRRIHGDGRGRPFRIVVLPSLTAAFEVDPSAGAFSRDGFRSTGAFRQAVDSVTEQLRLGLEPLPHSGRPWTVEVADRRPLVVTPENAAQVIAQVCPKADFVIVLLGKDVYLALHMDPKRDQFPAADRLFVDIDDARYGLAADDIRRVAGHIRAMLVR